VKRPILTLANYKAAIAARAIRAAEARERERLLQLYQALPVIGYMPSLTLARARAQKG
jgi:hypothetical protein